MKKIVITILGIIGFGVAFLLMWFAVAYFLFRLSFGFDIMG